MSHSVIQILQTEARICRQSAEIKKQAPKKKGSILKECLFSVMPIHILAFARHFIAPKVQTQ
jgi:hypothetical protein